MKQMQCIFVAAFVGVVWADLTAEEAMDKIEKDSHRRNSDLGSKYWDYQISLKNEAKLQAYLNTLKEFQDYFRKNTHPALLKYPWKTFSEGPVKRKYFIESLWYNFALSEEERTKLNNLRSQMISIYNNGKVKEYESADDNAMLGVNDIKTKFAEDYLDAKEMAYYWSEWHNTVGRQEKDNFEKWVAFQNEITKLTGDENSAERWHQIYQTKDFEKEIARLSETIEPLFRELHAYIRHKLWIAHKEDSSVIDPEGPIPASLLGSLWGQEATNIYSITVPYSNIPLVNITSQLKDKGFDGRRMAKQAELFYESMGMGKENDEFWEYSIFEKGDREMDCTTSGVQFFNGSYRIKSCAPATHDEFTNMYNQMGMIQNVKAYQHQSFFFQDTAIPGFTQAIGDMFSIFANVPTYLKEIGLLHRDTKFDDKYTINALFKYAIEDVFFLPYAYSLDLWRWDVMKGKIAPGKYNCEYWKRRIALQGVEPPVDRDEKDFDPGAKYHINDASQFIEYYVINILKYQFHESMCKLSGDYDPQKPQIFCDVFKQKTAGEKLYAMMGLGKSKPWPETLKVLTGKTTFDAEPLLRFYDPLYKWLKDVNKSNGVKTTWERQHNRCRS